MDEITKLQDEALLYLRDNITREEARNVFGGSIVNNLLSLGAEPTNVVRQDGLIEWKVMDI